ncbi:MAG TPA: S8 family peptidase [Blastocatellia bacterium]|nr:S8 family peptidase [Blastocatellia bacterium]
MKKHLSLLFALLFLASGLTSHEAAYPQGRTGERHAYVDGEMLIEIKAGADVMNGSAIIAGEILPGRAATAERLSPAAQSAGLFLVKFDPAISVREAIQQAEADPRVEYAEPNYYLYPAATLPDDSFFDRMWGLMNTGEGGVAGADIGATKAWDLTTGSDDIVVGVTDTGADFSHPDLGPNAWINPGEITGNGLDDDANGFVDDINGWNFQRNTNQLVESLGVDLHGTHVTGTIGATGNNGVGVTGVAWRVKLMSLKFIGAATGRLTGEVADAIRAINYAIDQRRRGVNVRVINASWGPECGENGKSKSLRKAIAAAGDGGILFVCAAGNGGCDGAGDDLDEAPQYPAAYTDALPTMISVASLDRFDTLARYSNFGHTTVDVGAPGGSCSDCLNGIVSTVPGAGYRFLQGTSMATPHVVGIAVLLWSREPDLTPAEIKQRVLSTTDPVLDLASRVVSSGRANAYNALTRTVPEAQTRPAIRAVITGERSVTVDGLGYLGGISVIEINGFAASRMRYDSSYSLANGTLTRLRAKLGKNGMRATFPRGIAVSVTVFNPTTGQRSDPVMYARP